MVQETGNRLISTILKQTEKIVYFCSAENISPNLAVHEFRKSFKRLRALLHFYDDYPVEFPSDYRIQIQEFGRFLAPIRESYVNIQIFDRITTGNKLITEKKLRSVKEILGEKNRTQVENIFLSDKGSPAIELFIKDFVAELEFTGKGRPSTKQLMDNLRLSFQKSYDIFQLLGENSEPVQWHELRKKMKRLWYQFDFVKSVHPKYFRVKSDQLNKITEQLGEDHDLFVFMNEIGSNDYGFDTRELHILENQIDHLRELNRIKLNTRLKQFFSETTEEFNQKLERIFKIT